MAEFLFGPGTGLFWFLGFLFVVFVATVALRPRYEGPITWIGIGLMAGPFVLVISMGILFPSTREWSSPDWFINLWIMVFSTGFVVLVANALDMLADDVSGFAQRGREKTPGHYLHQHGDLWHEHPYERSHFHPEGINGPFVYVDERYLDQREGR